MNIVPTIKKRGQNHDFPIITRINLEKNETIIAHILLFTCFMFCPD